MEDNLGEIEICRGDIVIKKKREILTKIIYKNNRSSLHGKCHVSHGGYTPMNPKRFTHGD